VLLYQLPLCFKKVVCISSCIGWSALLHTSHYYSDRGECATSCTVGSCFWFGLYVHAPHSKCVCWQLIMLL
jgi:hypothetical protein